ncbi:hypothetical protein CBM2637_A60069 [Cupriavidus taiwanensis]|nr:hypothetical protein CBM2637_A60069 [Cupriavidus taiwanensis]
MRRPRLSDAELRRQTGIISRRYVESRIRTLRCSQSIVWLSAKDAGLCQFPHLSRAPTNAALSVVAQGARRHFNPFRTLRHMKA